MTVDRRNRRRPLRLPGYDYSQAGAYFVTVCTRDRECLFGSVVDGEMVLNDAGRVVWQVWQELPTRFPTVGVDQFIVMPNHVHGIIVIDDADGAITIPVGAQTSRAKGNPASSQGAATSQGAASSAPTGESDTTVGALLAAPHVDAPDVLDPTEPAPHVDAPDLVDTIEPAPHAATPVGAPLTAPPPLAAPHDSAPAGAGRRAPTLAEVMRAFKSLTAVQINRLLSRPGQPLWQRTYYERIIRNDEELGRIRHYIDENPLKWDTDRENPAMAAQTPRR